jgi:hypothetical protein
VFEHDLCVRLGAIGSELQSCLPTTIGNVNKVMSLCAPVVEGVTMNRS